MQNGTKISKLATQDKTLAVNAVDFAFALLDDKCAAADTQIMPFPPAFEKPSKLDRVRAMLRSALGNDINAEALRLYNAADKHVARFSRGATRTAPLRSCLDLTSPSRSAAYITIALTWYAIGTILDR